MILSERGGMLGINEAKDYGVRGTPRCGNPQYNLLRRCCGAAIIHPLRRVKPIRLDASNKNRRSAVSEAPSNETPAPCAREHQISVHALPPRELSFLGASLDYFGRAFSFPRNEFRHRFFRRHLARAPRQERR